MIALKPSFISLVESANDDFVTHTLKFITLFKHSTKTTSGIRECMRATFSSRVNPPKLFGFLDSLCRLGILRYSHENGKLNMEILDNNIYLDLSSHDKTMTKSCHPKPLLNIDLQEEPCQNHDVFMTPSEVVCVDSAVIAQDSGDAMTKSCHLKDININDLLGLPCQSHDTLELGVARIDLFENHDLIYEIIYKYIINNRDSISSKSNSQSLRSLESDNLFDNDMMERFGKSWRAYCKNEMGKVQARGSKDKATENFKKLDKSAIEKLFHGMKCVIMTREHKYRKHLDLFIRDKLYEEFTEMSLKDAETMRYSSNDKSNNNTMIKVLAEGKY